MLSRRIRQVTGVRRAAVLGVLILATLLSTTGCDDFALRDLLDPAGTNGTEGPLEISPIAATVVVGKRMTFTASGGEPPYAFTVVSGSGSVESSSGVYTAPDAASIDVVRVTDDSAESSDAQVVVVE